MLRSFQKFLKSSKEKLRTDSNVSPQTDEKQQALDYLNSLDKTNTFQQQFYNAQNVPFGFNLGVEKVEITVKPTFPIVNTDLLTLQVATSDIDFDVESDDPPPELEAVIFKLLAQTSYIVIEKDKATFKSVVFGDVVSSISINEDNSSFIFSNESSMVQSLKGKFDGRYGENESNAPLDIYQNPSDMDTSKNAIQFIFDEDKERERQIRVDIFCNSVRFTFIQPNKEPVECEVFIQATKAFMAKPFQIEFIAAEEDKTNFVTMAYCLFLQNPSMYMYSYTNNSKSSSSYLHFIEPRISNIPMPRLIPVDVREPYHWPYKPEETKVEDTLIQEDQLQQRNVTVEAVPNVSSGIKKDNLNSLLFGWNWLTSKFQNTCHN